MFLFNKECCYYRSSLDNYFSFNSSIVFKIVNVTLVSHNGISFFQTMGAVYTYVHIHRSKLQSVVQHHPTPNTCVCAISYMVHHIPQLRGRVQGTHTSQCCPSLIKKKKQLKSYNQTNLVKYFHSFHEETVHFTLAGSQHN